MRLNGHGALTLEDARTWIEETGLCLFLPKRQFSSSIAPSFVEAVAGKRDATPDPEHIALAEELLVRLEIDGVAVRLNLLGLPGEAARLRGGQLGSALRLCPARRPRLAPQPATDRFAPGFAAGRPGLQAAGGGRHHHSPSSRMRWAEKSPKAPFCAPSPSSGSSCALSRSFRLPARLPSGNCSALRFQKAIAEGASTSQVTAISVLASIYLQAVIAAGMEEVEMFLAPLTARSKVREVLRGLVATRQVHTISHGPRAALIMLPARCRSSPWLPPSMPALDAGLCVLHALQ